MSQEYLTNHGKLYIKVFSNFTNGILACGCAVGAVSQSASTVSSPAPLLLGQPQVAAPQYIVTYCTV